MESLYAGDTIWELCGVEILEWNFEEDIPIIYIILNHICVIWFQVVWLTIYLLTQC